MDQPKRTINTRIYLETKTKYDILTSEDTIRDVNLNMKYTRRKDKYVQYNIHRDNNKYNIQK